MTDLIDIKTPTIHTNGTHGADLYEQANAVRTTIRDAVAATEAAAPHGRDYYTQGDAALPLAIAQHCDRLARLRSLLGEWGVIAESISLANQARARR